MRLPPNAHNALVSRATQQLGEIHWYLLRASALVESRTIKARRVKGPLGRAGFTIPERTAFGEEVGRDEIHWWIWKKETDIGTLRSRTASALNACNNIYAVCDRLQKARPTSYANLIQALRDFADTNGIDIGHLHEYVSWLYMKDALAPSILYTYRVWGSTRRCDRSVPLHADTLPAEKSRTMQVLAHAVLGLRGSFGLYAYEQAYMDIAGEIANGMDPESNSAGTIKVPPASVIARTAADVYHECTVYFREIRQSLRNILLDIDKFVEQRGVVHSDQFWRTFVERAAQTRTVEPQLWDFKETLSLWHAPKGRARDQAKVALAEDVAGFANARGGVLIVGVADDQPRRIVGIGTTPREVETRLKLAKTAIADHVKPHRIDVVFRQVLLSGHTNSEAICLVIVVPQAAEPIGVHDGTGRYSYPVRRETGLDRVAQLDLAVCKDDVKGENCDFLRELVQFTGTV
jgi:hypothetical protein